jgi:hypothetical protein
MMFENVKAAKGTNLEIEEPDKIVLHNGVPFLPTATDGAAVKAIATPTATDGASDIINVENLVKVYPGGTRPVDGISCLSAAFRGSQKSSIPKRDWRHALRTRALSFPISYDCLTRTRFA